MQRQLVVWYVSTLIVRPNQLNRERPYIAHNIAMTSVNGFTPEGLPKLVLKNMPVDSSLPGLTVTLPQIYFGELTHTDVYVKTRQQEFNYLQGEQNNMAAYHGSGGIRIGGLLRRTLIAYDRGDIAKQSAPRAAKPPNSQPRKGAMSGGMKWLIHKGEFGALGGVPRGLSWKSCAAVRRPDNG